MQPVFASILNQSAPCWPNCLGVCLPVVCTGATCVQGLAWPQGACPWLVSLLCQLNKAGRHAIVIYRAVIISCYYSIAIMASVT
jgi:hypothetical protein